MDLYCARALFVDNSDAFLIVLKDLFPFYQIEKEREVIIICRVLCVCVCVRHLVVSSIDDGSQRELLKKERRRPGSGTKIKMKNHQ